MRKVMERPSIFVAKKFLNAVPSAFYVGAMTGYTTHPEIKLLHDEHATRSKETRRN